MPVTGIPFVPVHVHVHVDERASNKTVDGVPAKHKLDIGVELGVIEKVPPPAPSGTRLTTPSVGVGL